MKKLAVRPVAAMKLSGQAEVPVVVNAIVVNHRFARRKRLC